MSFPQVRSRLGLLSCRSSRVTVGSLALLLASVGGGCATARAPVSSEAQLASTVEKLRAENAAYARKVEELENQVFILNDELTARRGGEPPAPVAPAALTPPALPEVKLSPHAKLPEPENANPPESLVDETVVEYSGAAANRAGKRPLLRLWGADGAGASAEAEAETTTAPLMTPVREPRPVRRRPEPTSSSGSVSSPRQVEAPPARASAGDDAGMRAYKSALDLVQARRHDEAVTALRAFVKTHPDHDYADNAQYWLGECFYDRKDYSTALREFRRVVERFPQGNKVPDALLKTAFSYLALGSARPGRDTLVQITREHPRHPAASLAAAKLAELDGAGASLGTTGGRVSAAAVRGGQ